MMFINTVLREIPIKIGTKIGEFFKNSLNFIEISQESTKLPPTILTKFSANFEIGPVQKHVNLVDLVKSFPTQNRSYLQRVFSIIYL